MNIRNTFLHPTLLVAVGLVCVSATLNAAPPNENGSRVEISWTNPADFSEAKENAGIGLGRQPPDEWLGELAKHLRYRAERVLPQQEHLEVTFTDVQRAGTYEPWRGPRFDDVRIIKDIYPPRIDLTFTLSDGSGGVIKQGTRELRDPSFLQRGRLNETDPLRFEKRMLDDWLRSEFPDAGDARG